MNTAQLHNCQGRHFCPTFFPKKPGGFPVPKTNISHKILEIFLKTSSKCHKIFLHLSTVHINLLPHKYTCRYTYVSIYIFLFIFPWPCQNTAAVCSEGQSGSLHKNEYLISHCHRVLATPQMCFYAIYELLFPLWDLDLFPSPHLSSPKHLDAATSQWALQRCVEDHCRRGHLLVVDAEV